MKHVTLMVFLCANPFFQCRFAIWRRNAEFCFPICFGITHHINKNTIYQTAIPSNNGGDFTNHRIRNAILRRTGLTIARRTRRGEHKNLRSSGFASALTSHTTINQITTHPEGVDSQKQKQKQQPKWTVRNTIPLSRLKPALIPCRSQQKGCSMSHLNGVVWMQMRCRIF
jgi:hypothetical protein